jgi:hypothetical protein
MTGDGSGLECTVINQKWYEIHFGARPGMMPGRTPRSGAPDHPGRRFSRLHPSRRPRPARLSYFRTSYFRTPAKRAYRRVITPLPLYRSKPVPSTLRE